MEIKTENISSATEQMIPPPGTSELNRYFQEENMKTMDQDKMSTCGTYGAQGQDRRLGEEAGGRDKYAQGT